MTTVVAGVPDRGETVAADSVVAADAAEIGAANTHSSSTVTTDAPSHDRTPCALFRRSSTSKLKPPGPGEGPIPGSRMSAASGASNGTGVRVQPAVQGDLGGTGAACHHRSGGSGGVWIGRMGPPPDDDDPEWSWRQAVADRRLASCSRSPDPDPTDTPAD